VIWLLLPVALGVGFAAGRWTGHLTVRRANEALTYAKEELAARKAGETWGDRFRGLRIRPERPER
jgi:hypothetical protein